MGFFDWLFGTSSPNYPTISSCMALSDRDLIEKGQLPNICTNLIFLQKSEVCYYIDNARLMNERVVKDYLTKHYGHGGRGLLPGSYYGRSSSKKIEIGEHVEQDFYDGKLFVTNKRMIFLSKEAGFDKRHTSIAAIKPYSNAIEIQYGSKTYNLFVPDGYLLNDLFELLH